MDEVGSKQLFEPLLNPKIGYKVFILVFGGGAVGVGEGTLGYPGCVLIAR